MRIFLCSDTHSSRDYIAKIPELFRLHEADELFFLGDYYDDADAWVAEGIPVIRVPGTWTSVYQNALVDNRRIEERFGWRFLLSHTPEVHYNDLPGDPDPLRVISEEAVHFFLHGHTHRPCIETIGETVVINPGHLKWNCNRGYGASYAVLDVGLSRVGIVIFDLLDGGCLFEKVVVAPKKNPAA